MFEKIKKILGWVVGLIVTLLSVIGLSSLRGNDKKEEKRKSDERNEEVEDIEEDREKTKSKVDELSKRQKERLDDHFILLIALLLSAIMALTLAPVSMARVDAEEPPDTYDELLKEYKKTRENWLEAEEDLKEALSIIEQQDEQIERLTELYKLERDALKKALEESKKTSLYVETGVNLVPYKPKNTGLQLNVGYNF